mgnify:CR=1 FL=1
MNFTRENEYWDGAKTYEFFDQYYLAPIGYFLEGGYKSYNYNETYFDGYGTNFYYGEHKYYHDSWNINNTTKNILWAVGAVVILIPCCYMFITEYKKEEIEIKERKERTLVRLERREKERNE